MNCKQARDLFSSRIDNELDGSEAVALDRHLASCSACAASWASFETTVRLLHAMPQVSPNASFVGQVLDRVRAYEAEQELLPDHPVYLPAREGILARIRARVGRINLVSGTWIVPARLSAVTALGLLAGFLLVETGLIPAGHVPALVATGTTAAVAPVAATSAGAQADRPLAPGVRQLAEEVARSDSAAKAAVSATGPREVLRENRGPGRQVFLQDERPRITF